MKDDSCLICEALKTLQSSDTLSAHLSTMTQLCDFVIQQDAPLDLERQVDFAVNMKLMCSSIAQLRGAIHLLSVATQTNDQ